MKMNNRQAFLNAIAACEGTLDIGDNGYDVLFGSTKERPILFTKYDDHPRVRTYEKNDEFIRNGRKDFTTAAGRYQITATMFDAYARLLGIKDFYPAAQDAIALQMIKERGALPDIDAGRIDAAVKKVSSIWASLPNAGYGQPERKIEFFRKAFVEAGGVMEVV
jgi:muramidase (phage lysozyme)